MAPWDHGYNVRMYHWFGAEAAAKTLKSKLAIMHGTPTQPHLDVILLRIANGCVSGLFY